MKYSTNSIRLLAEQATIDRAKGLLNHAQLCTILHRLDRISHCIPNHDRYTSHSNNHY